MRVNKKDIEAHRARWADIAKKYGWYSEPFPIQIFVNEKGIIVDSIAHGGLVKDGGDLIVQTDAYD